MICIALPLCLNFCYWMTIELILMFLRNQCLIVKCFLFIKAKMKPWIRPIIPWSYCHLLLTRECFITINPTWHGKIICLITRKILHWYNNHRSSIELNRFTEKTIGLDRLTDDRIIVLRITRRVMPDMVSIFKFPMTDDIFFFKTFESLLKKPLINNNGMPKTTCCRNGK